MQLARTEADGKQAAQHVAQCRLSACHPRPPTPFLYHVDRIERPAPDPTTLASLNERSREIFRGIVDFLARDG